MMKITSNKLIATVILTANLALPIASFAQSNPSDSGRRASICSRIDQVMAPIEQRITDRKEKIQDRWQQIDNTLFQRRDERDTKLTEFRSTRDEARQAAYAKLEAKATTNEEKAAVQTFKTTTEAAVATRKAAIDDAISSLRKALDNAKTNHRDAVDTAITQFTNAKSTAISQAKTACSSNVDGQTVRETLRNDLKVARDQFRTDRQAIVKLRGSFETIRDEKKASVQTAVSNFQATMETAKATLKAAFNQ